MALEGNVPACQAGGGHSRHGSWQKSFSIHSDKSSVILVEGHFAKTAFGHGGVQKEQAPCLPGALAAGPSSHQRDGWGLAWF